MKNTAQFVITINRQLGCGGSYIGQNLAKELDIFYADREIIREAAQQLSLLESQLESRDEKLLSFWQSFVYTTAFTPDIYVPPRTLLPTDLELFVVEAKIIERIAQERSALIMGRCGFHILREYPNCISLFLHADQSFRNERIRKQYPDLTEEEANKMIAQSDKERASYCKTFTGKEWTDPRNFNLAIDTGKTGIDNTVQLILNYFKLYQSAITKKSKSEVTGF